MLYKRLTYGELCTECPECRGRLLSREGEVVCSSCGVVVGMEAEETVTAEAATAGLTLGSMIGKRELVQPKSTLSKVKDSLQVSKVSESMQWYTSWNESCSKLTQRIGEKLRLRKVTVKTAIHISRRITREGKIGKASVPVVSAYSLFCASRLTDSPLTLRRIIQAYKDAGHRVSASKILSLSIASRFKPPTVDVEKLTSEILSRVFQKLRNCKLCRLDSIKLNASLDNLQSLARAISQKAKNDGKGFSPRTIAAGSVYLTLSSICPRAVNQDTVAQMLGISQYAVKEFCAWYRSESGRRISHSFPEKSNLGDKN
jgi:Transcription initiation factor TFIIIB, Brf1 subunit/Transcription initiation factor TFIIB